MTDIHPNFAAIKAGLIPVNSAEQLKLDKDGLDVVHDIYRYAKTGFASIDEGDFDRMKWYGVYRQKPKDGGYFMMRTKVPGGQLTGAQAVVLSNIADQYGHGFCDITTRQTIQFHWFRIEDIPDIFHQLEQVGMTTSGACGDISRNVIGCPVAGIDPDAIIDASPLVKAVSANLTNNKSFSNLPRKYKVSIGGCRIHCTQPDINCVGVFGLERQKGSGKEAGYGIMLGGGLSSSPHLAQKLPVFLHPEQVWPVIEANTIIFRDQGYRAKRNRARFKFLVADWGHEKMRHEIENLIGYKLEDQGDIPVIADQEYDHTGVHKQIQPGLNWVGIVFPGGRVRGSTLAVLGKLATKYAEPGKDVIRLTNKQNLILSNIPDASLPALLAELDIQGLDYQPSNFRQGCVSCTGIEFCNLAVAETKNRMIELVDQLEATSGWYKKKIRIHFSGCPSSCGQHQIADIGFRGARTKIDGQMVDAYDMFIGGRLGENRRFNELLKGKIIAKDVDKAIDKVLRYFDANKASEEETFAQFADRVPKSEILTALV